MTSRKKEVPSLPPLDKSRRFTVEQSLLYLATSRATFYKLVADGRIATIKEGKRTYVPGSEIVRLSSVPSQATPS